MIESVLLAGGAIALAASMGVAVVSVVFRLTRNQPRSLPPAGSGEFDVDAIRRSLANQLQNLIGQVSPDVLGSFQHVHRHILDMLPRASRLPAGSEDLFILERTATDYLPTAFASYVSLAQAGAADQRLANGRTPHELLLEQLRLIETKLEEMAEAINRNDVDRLLAHGRFLEDRFGNE